MNARGAARPWAAGLGWTYSGAAVVIVAVVPLAIVLRGTWEGLGVVMRDFVLANDILAAVAFAAWVYLFV